MSRRSSSSSISTFSSIRDDDQMMRDCYELKRRLLQTEKALQNLSRSNNMPSYESHHASRTSFEKNNLNHGEQLPSEAPILTLDDLSPKSSLKSDRSDYHMLELSRSSSRLYRRGSHGFGMEADEKLGQERERDQLLGIKSDQETRSLNVTDEKSFLSAENEKLRLDLESASFEVEELKAQLSNSELCLHESLRSSDAKKRRIKELEEKLTEAHRSLRIQSTKELNLKDENEKLQSTISQQEEMLKTLEKDAQNTSNILNEKNKLEEICKIQNTKIVEYQQEIEQTKMQMSSLEEQVQNVQNHFLQMQRNSTSCVHSDDERSTPQSPSPAATIADLKLKLAKQEAENQKLQTFVNAHIVSQQKQATDHGNVSDIRTELSAVVERSRIGDRKQQELERVVTRLEDEVSSYTNQILDLEEKLNDRVTINGKLEEKLYQKNGKISELQRELDQKCTINDEIGLKMRQQDLEIKKLVDELEKKEIELLKSNSKVQELDVMMEEKQKLVKDAEEALGFKENENKQVAGVIQKIKILHAEHCKELEQQIDLLQQRLDNKTKQLAKVETALSSVQQDVSIKDGMHDKLQRELEEAQKRIRELDGHEKKLKLIQEQASEESEHVAQLETSLTQCRQELQLLADKTEENKRTYEETMEKTTQQLSYQVNITNTLKSELTAKVDEMKRLRMVLEEREEMLITSQHRISELEELHETTQTEVTRFREENIREKAERDGELKALKLQAERAGKDLVERTGQIGELDAALKEAHTELRLTTDKNNELEEKLTMTLKERQAKEDDNENLRNRLLAVTSELHATSSENLKLQTSLRETNNKLADNEYRCNSLEKKVEIAQEELKQTLEQLSELESVLKESRTTVQEREKQVSELDRRLVINEEELQRRENALKCHEQQLMDMEKTMRDKHFLLKQKTLQVAQLDMSLKEQKSELEQKVNVLDSNLNQTRIELDEKTIEVSDLKAQVDKLESSDRDKTAKITNLEKLLEQNSKMLVEKTSRLNELEKMLALQQETDNNAEQKAQEVRVAKEEILQLRDEIQLLRKELIKKENSEISLTKELDNCHALLAEKESDCTRLARELGACQVREAQAEAKAVKDLRRIGQQLEMQLKLKEQEIEKLHDKHADEITTKEQALTQLKLSIRRAEDEMVLKQNDLNRYEQRLVDYEQDFMGVKRELELQQERSKELGDTLILKESEITRLEAKVSGYERATFGITPRRQTSVRSPRPVGQKDRAYKEVPRPASVASAPLNINASNHVPDTAHSSLLVPDLTLYQPHSTPARGTGYSRSSYKSSLFPEHQSEFRQEDSLSINDLSLSKVLLDATPPSDLGLTLNQSSL